MIRLPATKHLPAAIGTAAAATNTVIETYVLFGEYDRCAFDVTNTETGGGTAFDAFVVQIQGVQGGNWTDLTTAYSSLSALLLYFSTNMAALAAAANGTIIVNTAGAYAVRVAVSGNSATAGVSLSGMASSTR